MSMAAQSLLMPALSWPEPQRRTAAPADDVRKTAVAVSAVMLALLLPTVIALGVDGRTLNGANLWLKPMHFELALAINFATLAILLPLLTPAWQSWRALRWAVAAAGASAIMEIFWIAGEAALGRGSHFNVATPLEAILYPISGVGSLLITLGSVTFGIALWRSPSRPGTSHLHRGATLGLILGSAATLIVAGYMSAQHGHLVGGPQTDAFGLPFLGWSTRSGDLRVPHFFATHAMQALPVAGFLAGRLGMAHVGWLMPIFATAYVAVVFGLFAQALLGIPFIAR